MSHTATLESIATARTHLDDLQAEMEAAARFVERLRADATEMDSRVVTYIQQTARMHALLDCANELRASIAEQRAILRNVRKSIDQVRQSIRRRR